MFKPKIGLKLLAFISDPENNQFKIFLKTIDD